MSVDRKKKRPASARRFRRRITASAAFTSLIVTAGVGAGAAAYLYYDAFYSSGWHTHSEGTYYILSETGERATGMQSISNAMYLFDDNGIMLTGWQEYEGEKYYLDSSGVIQRGRIKIDGEEYYFADDSGIFRTGLRDFNGAEYYFDDHGFPGSDLIEKDGKSYYYDPNGLMVTGWAKLHDIQYYFKTDGSMAKGFLEIDGLTYCFAEDGHLLTGEQHIEGKIYQFGDNGVLFKGWLDTGKGYRYADEQTGAFVTGFFKYNGNTYYFDTDLNMVTGWTKIADGRYHFGDDGVMDTGWFMEAGVKYYFGSDGKAYTGFNTIEKVTYYFDDKGRLLTGWYTEPASGSTYYLGYDGVVQDGFYEDGDAVYYFDPYTHAACKGWLSVYDQPQETAAELETFLSDAKLIKKNNKLVDEGVDVTTELTQEELARIDEINKIYTEGSYERACLDAYNSVGSKITNLQLFDSSSAEMKRGFQKIKGHIFYFDEETGVKATGWREIEDKTYYFGCLGIAATGQVTIGGKNYYFDKSGVLTTGITKTEEGYRWRLAEPEPDEDGNVDPDDPEAYFAHSTFKEDDEGRRYYFNEKGAMAIGEVTSDAQTYKFDETGVLIEGEH